MEGTFSVFLNMKRHTLIFFFLIHAFPGLLLASGHESEFDRDSVQTVTPGNKRTYQTARMSYAVPKIDGILEDDCWTHDGNWAGDFLQSFPVEGAQPSDSTHFKILYDDRYIYVAIRAFQKPVELDAWPAKRDQFGGDMVGVNFDSYHDYRTAFEFDMTPKGGKMDLLVTSPKQINVNWNAVWDGKAALEDSAWTVEMRIPLSQLRYANRTDQVWGMQAWRAHSRNSEESHWSMVPPDSPTWLAYSGTLTGLRTEKKSRRLEIMPYGLGMLMRSEKVEGDPFRQGLDHRFTGGLDTKIGLTTDFTMDITFNPDFGQVEADPSVLNLTTYETFFVEKRPFFLEGDNLLEVNAGSDKQLFYSRRIGHRPQYNPGLLPDEYAGMPENTSILSAVKITGKNEKGLSLGIMQSVTSRETAEIRTEEGPSRYETVEPLTSYTVARLQQDYNEGNTVMGGILTGTNRSLGEDHLDFLARSAYTGGIDFIHQWQEKTYYVKFNTLFSSVHGDEDAITRLQYSSVRYMNRPDFGHLGIDSSLTSLAGSGALFGIGKAGNSRIRYSFLLDYASPGLELNDIGYLYTADQITQRTRFAYVINDPFSIFRTFSASLSQTNVFNAGVDYLSSTTAASLSSTFVNRWNGSIGVSRSFEGLYTNTLRGGPALMTPGSWAETVGLATDRSRDVSLVVRLNAETSDDDISGFFSFDPTLTFRFDFGIQLSGSMNYSKGKENLQWVGLQQINDEPRYIMALLDRKTLGLTFRADYGITPDLTLQYYGSPYISTGVYSDFKYVTDPRAEEYSERFHLFTPQEIALDPSTNRYIIDETGNGTTDYDFYNPDFSFKQFRSNFVVRWEYRPGSILYFVWQHSRTGYESITDPSIAEGFRNLWDIFPSDVIMLKLNYWFSL